MRIFESASRFVSSLYNHLFYATEYETAQPQVTLVTYLPNILIKYVVSYFSNPARNVSRPYHVADLPTEYISSMV
jgi:hypothetical protein